jgi:sugar transferase (PEP-CTERM/EpsH1 system associated)
MARYCFEQALHTPLRVGTVRSVLIQPVKVDASMTDTQTQNYAVSPALPVAESLNRPAGSDPLRVLHVLTFLGQGGTENVVLNLIGGFRDQLFEQEICTTRGYDLEFARAHQLENRVHSAGRAVATLQFPIFRLARIMLAYRPHIVHTRNWGGLEAVPAAKLARVPVIIHSEHGYEMESLSSLPLRRRLFRRAAYAMADAVFTVTKELRDYHASQAWLASERIRVLYNGVDVNRFAPRQDLRRNLRSKFGWSADSFVIGTVGRVVPIKDQTTLLRAAEQLIGSGIDAHVLLVGGGPEEGRLRQYVSTSARLSRRVHLTGASEHVDELLNAMDVFVLPSLKEGMSNTLLEAMATNLAVLATRVGGNPEIVEDGHSGWLFAPKDVSGLAGRLTQLAKDEALRQGLGCSARQRVVTKFSLDLMIESYRNLYLETAASKGLRTRSEAAI